MQFQTAPDITILVTVPGDDPQGKPRVAAERRITPTWTIGQLKSKLEPITGIPSSSQSLRTTLLDGTVVHLSDDTALVNDPAAHGVLLRKNSELQVLDTRPPGARQDFTDVSLVDKYEMPVAQYEMLDDSVLAWKRRQKLGRFDPNAKSAGELVDQRRRTDGEVVAGRGIAVDMRCRVGSEDTRRGVVRYVGEIEGLGGEREAGCVWVGVELDEPSGRNDGAATVDVNGVVGTKRLFTCKDKYGVFVRPEKVEVGDFPPHDDLLDDDDMEEL